MLIASDWLHPGVLHPLRPSLSGPRERNGSLGLGNHLMFYLSVQYYYLSYTTAYDGQDMGTRMMKMIS